MAELEKLLKDIKEVLEKYRYTVVSTETEQEEFNNYDVIDITKRIDKYLESLAKQETLPRYLGPVFRMHTYKDKK